MSAVAEKLTDMDLMVRGFQTLVATFGNVDAERFIALTIREPQDYTVWRERNMYIGESVHDVAKRARESGKRLRAKYGIPDNLDLPQSTEDAQIGH